MDIVKKIVQGAEAIVEEQTGFKKLDFNIVDEANIREGFNDGYVIRPSLLEQSDGGVGFVFFDQSFDGSLFAKFYRTSSQERIFELHEQLVKILQKLYTLRVTGDNYEQVNLTSINAQMPTVTDTYVRLDFGFVARYRITGVF